MIRRKKETKLSSPALLLFVQISRSSSHRETSSFTFASSKHSLPFSPWKRNTEFYRVDPATRVLQPEREEFPFRKIVLGNFPGPVRSEGRGAAERKEYKIKCGVARGRASGGEKGEREKETGLSLSRGSSKRTGIGDRSERRLLGSGQWLAATANFSSPCGRMTVTFFRSKAGRILSSGAFSAPFCLSSSQATDSRTSLLHGTKPSSLSLSLSRQLSLSFSLRRFFLFFFLSSRNQGYF